MFFKYINILLNWPFAIFPNLLLGNSFYHSYAQSTIFNLAVKQVKDNPGSPLIDILQNLIPQCYNAQLLGHRTSGSGEEDFNGFTIYRRGGPLGLVTWTIHIHFHSPSPRRLHMKFGYDLPSGFREEDV